jgi:excisionase family DNA binding protein
MNKAAGELGKIYTIEEIGQILRVDNKTVYRLVAKKELVAFQIGRVFRVTEVDFRAYISAMKERVRNSPKKKY